MTEASQNARETNEITGGSEGAPERSLDDLYDALFKYRYPVYTVDALSPYVLSSSSMSLIGGDLTQLSDTEIDMRVRTVENISHASGDIISRIIETASNQSNGIVVQSFNEELISKLSEAIA